MYVYNLEFVDRAHKLKTITVPDIRTPLPISASDSVYLYGTWDMLECVAHYFYGRDRQGFTRLTFAQNPNFYYPNKSEVILSQYNKEPVKNRKANNFPYKIELTDYKRSRVFLKTLYFPNLVRRNETVYINDIPCGEPRFILNCIEKRNKYDRRGYHIKLTFICEKEWLTKNVAGLEDLILNNYIE
jgi:hypothetical protein